MTVNNVAGLNLAMRGRRGGGETKGKVNNVAGLNLAMRGRGVGGGERQKERLTTLPA